MSSSLSARERIESLLDENSFVEIGARVRARSTDFSLKPTEAPSDGVITGYGLIEGRPVYVYSQDASVLNGSVGEMHAKKIVNLYQLAQKTGSPVVGMLDSSGIRLQESTDALNALGEIYKQQVRASGVIPQICAVFGPCGGGMSILSSLADFTFLEKEKGRLFVNEPDTLKDNYKEKCDTAEAAFQGEKTGNVAVVCNIDEIFAEIRELVGFLPSNFEEEDADRECEDDLNRLTDNMSAELTDSALALFDLADDGNFYETGKSFAKEMVTGFLRLNGQVIGAVANRIECIGEDGKPLQKFDAALTERGCKKAARFVWFCDAFDIPVLTLTNTEGFAATVCEERRLSENAAALVSAFASATVPKVNVITQKAYGSPYVIMNSKAIGADLTFCLADTEIGVMDADFAAKILSDGKSSAETLSIRQKYAELQNNASSAAGRGYVDEMIDPSEVRKYLIGAFEILYSKCEEEPSKKHGTI